MFSMANAMSASRDFEQSHPHSQQALLLDDEEQFSIDEDSLCLPVSKTKTKTKKKSNIILVFIRSLHTPNLNLKIVYDSTRRLGLSLLPSFLTSAIPQSTATATATGSRQLEPTSSTNGPTAYLSGLRGVASMIVFIFHFIHGSYPGVDHAYGDGDQNQSILQLPIIRLFYAAEATVALFFAISGYVLSYGCVTQIRAGDFEKAGAVVSSLALRRAIRLFLPAVGSSFGAFLAQRAGWMPVRGLPQEYTSTVMGDTRMYLRYLGHLLDVWTWDVDLEGWWYNPQLWTVPVEFRCSMVLFLVLITTGRCRTSIRVVLDGALVMFCFLTSRWDMALFGAGTLLAELQVMREENQSETEKEYIETKDSYDPSMRLTKYARQLRKWILRLLLICVLILGLYLASYPASPPQAAPAYSFLSTLVQHRKSGRRIYYAFAAILILFSLSSLPVLQRPFNSSVARYLGRISYALYLVHGTLIRVVGGRILMWIWSLTGNQGWWSYNLGFGFAALLFAPVVIWAADVFEKLIDRTSVNLAKWTERKSI